MSIGEPSEAEQNLVHDFAKHVIGTKDCGVLKQTGSQEGLGIGSKKI